MLGIGARGSTTRLYAGGESEGASMGSRRRVPGAAGVVGVTGVDGVGFCAEDMASM